MALHFYMNGTTGAQDGVEISNGDLSNPLLFDGFYAASGVTLSKTKTIHIRADAGEVWHWVLVDICDTGTSAMRFNLDSGYCLAFVGYSYASSSTAYLSYNPFFSTLSDKNIPITITVRVVGGESSPSVTSKLVIVSGVKE